MPKLWNMMLMTLAPWINSSMGSGHLKKAKHRLLSGESWQSIFTTSGLCHVQSNKSQQPNHSKMLCCLHTFGTCSALKSQLLFPQSGRGCLPVPHSPPSTPDATFLGNTPPLSYHCCLASGSSPTFANISLSSPPTSLYPPSLHCISSEPLCTVGFP